MDDPDVGRWLLEFLAHQTRTTRGLANTLINKIAPAIPISNSDLRTKKTLLLTILQHEFSTLSIQQDMLQKLEVLEELHRLSSSPVSPSLSAAYCAVAVHCTLRYLHLVPSSSSSPPSDYLSAVNGIWRGRVREMEPCSLLFSEELNRWSGDIEASLRDTEMMERLGSVDSRTDAIEKLKLCLDEAWEDLGPSFLELAYSMLSSSDTAPAASTPHIYTAKDMNPLPPIENQNIDAPVENQSIDEPIENQCIDAPAENQSPDAPVEDAPNENQSTDAPIENQSPDACIENESADDVDFQEQHVCQTVHGEDDLAKTNTACQSKDHRPSLMERNNTARTYEWDKSADGFEEETSGHACRIQLPSPKRKRTSPLKTYEPAKIVRRRKAKKWTALEEETLRDAVNKFGEGNWKSILDSHKEIFDERTQVDLKDKWRNLTRYGAK